MTAMADAQNERSLLQSCRAAADLAAARADTHRLAYQESEREARVLLAQLKDLEEARQDRRDAVQRRWRARQDLRHAHALLQNAAPLPVAGRSKGLRTFDRKRAQDLVVHWGKRAAPLPAGCGGPGVYALFDGDELVYIGQAQNVAARIGQHFGGKQFTAASYVTVPRDRLDSVERMLINVFLPRLNRDGTTLAMRRALGAAK